MYSRETIHSFPDSKANSRKLCIIVTSIEVHSYQFWWPWFCFKVAGHWKCKTAIFSISPFVCLLSYALLLKVGVGCVCVENSDRERCCWMCEKAYLITFYLLHDFLLSGTCVSQRFKTFQGIPVLKRRPTLAGMALVYTSVSTHPTPWTTSTVQRGCFCVKCCLERWVREMQSTADGVAQLVGRQTRDPKDRGSITVRRTRNMCKFYWVTNAVLTHCRCAQPPCLYICTHKNDHVRTIKIL